MKIQIWRLWSQPLMDSSLSCKSLTCFLFAFRSWRDCYYHPDGPNLLFLRDGVTGHLLPGQPIQLGEPIVAQPTLLPIQEKSAAILVSSANGTCFPHPSPLAAFPHLESTLKPRAPHFKTLCLINSVDFLGEPKLGNC
jgi:hypothetical protein